MIVDRHGVGVDDGVPARGVVHAVRTLRIAGADRPVVLLHTPAYANNPYQELLYRAAWGRGVAPVPVPRATAAAGAADAAFELGAEVVLHVHWTNQLSRGDRDETRGTHASFRDDVERILDRGARLVWTVHNRLPHECEHVEEEVELRRWLVERADLVHVMGDATAAAVDDLYPLPPERTVVVPHPSYDGVYPDTIDRDRARWELGLRPDEAALLMFGGIRPYKGVALALDALDELLARGRRVRLLVAGQVMGDWDGREELELRLLRHAATVVELGRIPEVDVQRWCRAADLALLPYTTIVNSGVLLLGATYSLPVVSTSAGEVGGLVTAHTLGVTYPADGDASDLSDAVVSVLDGDRAAQAAAARSYADTVAPATVAQRFLTEVVDRLLS